MSVNRIENKNKDNLIINHILSEIKSLPKSLKEKKIEKEEMTKKLKLLKGKSKIFKKELEKISSKIIELEKEFSLCIIDIDKIKSTQKLILNSINLVNTFKFSNILNLDKKIKEIILIFINYNNGFIEELSFILNSPKELTNLLIGSYSYLKLLQNEDSQKYNQIKDKIINQLIEIRKFNIENPFDLIINYIENTFKILDIKDKISIYNNKKEVLINKKNETFIKLKLIENKIEEIENGIKSVDIYINDILSIIEKNKLLKQHSKTKNSSKKKKIRDSNTNESKEKILKEDSYSNNYNSCYSNNLSLTEKKRNNFEKNCFIINLSNIYDNLKEKKYYDGFENSFKISKTKNEINGSPKKMNFLNYYKIEELRKDIYNNFLDLKNNPLYQSSKLNTQRKKINISNLKNRVSTYKNNINNKKKINKNYFIKKEKKDINSSNTMLSFGNIALLNNDINLNNISFNNNSNNYIKHKSNRLYSSDNFKKLKGFSPNKNNKNKIPPNHINKSIKKKKSPINTQNSQINNDIQIKNNKSSIRNKINNDSPKKILITKSPEKQIKKKIIITNISSTNFKNTPPLSATNSDNLNYCTEKKSDKNNKSTYSKQRKFFFIDIKHNKTNLFDKLNKNINIIRRSQISYNKIKKNISDKDLKNIRKTENKSSDKTSSSLMVNLFKSNEKNRKINNIKQRCKEITKINIDLEIKKHFQKSKEIKKNDKFNKQIRIKNREENNKNINNNNNSIINLNFEYRIIPFKKYKTERTNLNKYLNNKNKNNNLKSNRNINENNYFNKKEENENNSSIINYSSQIKKNNKKKIIENFNFCKYDKKQLKLKNLKSLIKLK